MKLLDLCEKNLVDGGCSCWQGNKVVDSVLFGSWEIIGDPGWCRNYCCNEKQSSGWSIDIHKVNGC